MKFLSVLLLLVACQACTTDDEPAVATNELIIGLSFGECGGDCAFLYLLKDDMVFQDEGVDRVSGDPGTHAYSAAPLLNVDQLRYDSLFSELPGNLSSLESASFGCPDCADGGALHVIRLVEEGVYTSYVLDNDTENMTPSLQPYGRLLQRSLQEFRR